MRQTAGRATSSPPAAHCPFAAAQTIPRIIPAARKPKAAPPNADDWKGAAASRLPKTSPEVRNSRSAPQRTHSPQQSPDWAQSSP